MRCLVTGASGHVGSFLVRSLVAQGSEVFALVRPESDLWRLTGVLDQISLVKGDLFGDTFPDREIRDAAAEIVFHAAWYGVTGGFRNDEDQILKNVPGSLMLFRAAQEAGCSCWVGIGSQAEYGRVDGILREEILPKPETAYGVAKNSLRALTEKLCEMSGEVRFLWFRLLAAYGPMDDPRHLIPGLIERLLSGERPALTPGEQRWDYLYIEDAAEAMVRAALTTGATGVYNLGSGRAEAVRWLAEQIRDAIDPGLPLGFGEVPYRPDQVMQLQADNSKIQAATGWRPRITLEEGLQRTVAWHQQRRTDAAVGA